MGVVRGAAPCRLSEGMPEMTQPESGKAMGSVLGTLRVLEEVAQRHPIGVSELARLTGMPKSTVQRCLVTLREAGWLRVVDTERARWGVTSKALMVGLAAAGNDGLKEIAEPVLEELCNATEETIHLVIRDGSSLTVVMRKDSLQAVRTFVEVGTRAPIHATSSGVAILARLRPERVDEILAATLDRSTGNTMVTHTELLAEIDRTRERGYSINEASWWRQGVSAIGAAIVSPAGKPIAAIAVSVPTSRFSMDDAPRLGELAMKSANSISAGLHQV